LGEWVAGGSGVLLLVALSLPWYSAGDDAATGWQSFSGADVLMALAALLAIFGALATAARRSSAISVAAMALGVLPSFVAALTATWRLIDPAPPIDVTREIGAWLGFAAGLGVFAGTLLGIRDEGPARRSDAAAAKAGEIARRETELVPLPPTLGGGTPGEGHAQT
jgi:hypothetical protein